ncbi:helix-turn-helix domain-containing protein [Streptomyces lonarensis]|uniref:Helix-turn-helix transcriptional regulator n=1 Tax=Streptomyces lonarensis TaxID=700599 RepID=A0A7X6CX63_9ACTN|nr:helix-turn-helix transcriptional regulator [Streptomyces lonarensis]NJQ04232.1 helix-turn-helix transcriptional regulator [Streptomyces lonarensis]
MDTEWARLGDLLRSARKAQGLSQPAVAERLGLSGRAQVARIDRGDIKVVSDTLRAYAQLVGWTSGSVEAVLRGGEPTLADERKAPSVDVGDLSLRVIEALREGPLVDSQVVTLHTPGGRLRAAIVVRGDEDASPEELQAALEEWRDRERALHDDRS